MNDPLRKPRKLRFKVSRALLVSAPLVGSLACGEPPMVNPGPVDEPPPEERVNVPAVMYEPHTEQAPRPVESTNVSEQQAMEESAEGPTDLEENPEEVPMRIKQIPKYQNNIST